MNDYKSSGSKTCAWLRNYGGGEIGTYVHFRDRGIILVCNYNTSAVTFKMVIIYSRGTDIRETDKKESRIYER